jgi:hypothetical protein
LDLDVINPEIAELLELLKARDEYDEISELFDKHSRPWKNFSQDERNRLVARASSLISQHQARPEILPSSTRFKSKSK